MLGISISELTPSTDLFPSDQIPIARSSLTATRRIPGTALATTAQNLGTGTGIFAQKSSTTLQFYSLSCISSDIKINLVGNTIVLSIPSTIKTVAYGDNTTSSFTLTNPITSNINDFRVDLDGVLQEPDTDFTLSGSNLIFTSPPPSATKIVIIYKTQ